MTAGAGALEIDAVVPRLIRLGLLDAATVADSAIRIRAFPGRHQTFQVVIDDMNGFFVKLADGLSPGDRATLATEAAFLQAAAGCEPVRRIAPHLMAWISGDSLLITRLLVGYRTLRQEVRSRPPHQVPIGYWRLIGEALAECHVWSGPVDTVRTPSVWTRLRPQPAHLSALTLGELSVLQVLRDNQLYRALAPMQDSSEGVTFCHGDLRPENVLVTEREGQRHLRLVDWELSGLGDPLWDVAGALEMAITLSLGWRRRADIDLTMVQAASRAAWSGYLSRCEPEARAGGTTTALVQVVAARLIISALESAAMVNRLSTDAVNYLQIADNILADARRAVVELFALKSA